MFIDIAWACAKFVAYAEFVAPLLEKLLRTYFFRHFRVNLEAQCPFWDAAAYCTIRDCSVDEAEAALAKDLGDLDVWSCVLTCVQTCVCVQTCIQIYI